MECGAGRGRGDRAGLDAGDAMTRFDLQRMRELIVSFPDLYSHEDGRLALRETVGFCMFSQKPANDTAEFYQAVSRLGGLHTLRFLKTSALNSCLRPSSVF